MFATTLILRIQNRIQNSRILEIMCLALKMAKNMLIHTLSSNMALFQKDLRVNKWIFILVKLMTKEMSTNKLLFMFLLIQNSMYLNLMLICLASQTSLMNPLKS